MEREREREREREIFLKNSNMRYLISRRVSTESVSAPHSCFVNFRFIYFWYVAVLNNLASKYWSKRNFEFPKKKKAFLDFLEVAMLKIIVCDRVIIGIMLLLFFVKFFFSCVYRLDR